MLHASVNDSIGAHLTIYSSLVSVNDRIGADCWYVVKGSIVESNTQNFLDVITSEPVFVPDLVNQ